MTRWTMSEVEAAAPDAKAVAAARKLARPGPWSDTGSTSTLVWGKCQGSGATPYQVSVDLTGPAFKCSCPSRKFPCKHGLALLMLWVSGDGSVADVDAPADFAAEWQQGRQDRAASSASRRATEDDGPVDPEAQARRLARRVELMSSGLDDLELWLRDLVEQGLAGARQRPYAWWDGAAARLVDAQVPGLAERVRDMGGAVHRRDDWPDHLLAEAGRWYLAIRAWRRRDELDEHQVGDLRAVLGWPVPAEEVRARPPLADTWTVAGVHRSLEGRLQEQRTWLVGEASGRTVLVLDFAAGGQPLRVPQVVGTRVEAAVAPYPGTDPPRVLLPDDIRPVGRATGLDDAGSVDDALGRVAAALAANPFTERVPCVLGAVRVVPDEAQGAGMVVDAEGRALPLVSGTDLWTILAHTGGRPADLFVEVEEGAVRPLTLAVPDGLVGL